MSDFINIDEFKNRILHGDCIKGMQRIPDLSVNLTLTDIPYNEVNHNKSVNNRAKYGGQLRKFTKDKADELTFDLRKFLDEVKRITSGTIYIFCGVNQLAEIFNYFKHENEKEFMARYCIWNKTNPPVANGQHMWTQGVEFCVFAKRRKTIFNQHCKKNVWDFPTGRSKVHPTEKPLKLFEYLVESSSNEGDLVFDPCIGSGTTAIAAKNLGRDYLGFELDEGYHKSAIERVASI